MEKYLRDVQSKIDNKVKNVFICHRGIANIGGEVARLIYYNLLISGYPELVPYCASLCNNHDKFEEKSEDNIQSCNVFVSVFTKDFCETESSNDDQVRIELAVACGEYYDKCNNIHFVPIYAHADNQTENMSGLMRRCLKPWFCNDTTIKILRKKGYFKGKSDEFIHDNLVDFVKTLLQSDSNPVTLKIISQNGSTLQDNLVAAVDAIKHAYYQKIIKASGKIWIGTRLSDIENTGALLSGAITLFGENDENKQLFALCDEKVNERVDHNIQEDRQDEYICKKMHELVNNKASNTPLNFYFYNQLSKYTIKGLDDISSYCLCVNSEDLLKKISNKLSFHKNYGDIGEGNGLLKVIEGNYTNCDYSSICKRFGLSEEENKKFIVQAAVASGGSGTYIMTKDNASNLQKHLSQESDYLYSVYIEQNVPVNLHAIIFEQGIVLLPGSIQLMRTDFDKIEHEEEIKRLMYRGADFIEYSNISKLPNKKENKVNESHINKFKSLCVELCERLKKEGYVGVLGIDGMIYGEEVRLLEVNCRFQASTGLINKALNERGFASVQQANFDSFYDSSKFEEWKNIFENLEVNYSNYSFNNIGCNEHPKHVFEVVTANTEYENFLEKDGYNNDIDLDTCAPNSHLFRMNFRTNICWVNEDGSVLINENISEPIKEFKNMILSCARSGGVSQDAVLALKIALLTQGVVIEKNTLDYLESNQAKGIRQATNSAVDISFSQQFINKCNFAETIPSFVINAPRDIKFNEFTPFVLKSKRFVNGECILALYYYNTEISEVSLYPLDPIEKDGNIDRRTRPNNIRYSDVAYLSTDRLRVHVTNLCVFKKCNKGCKFCNISTTCPDIDIRDIKEVIDVHWRHRAETGLKHFLIGGQSPVQNEEMQEKLRQIITHIHGLESTPSIYAMILPCQNENELDKYEDLVKSYFKCGLNELSLNIEIFDDEIAKKYMPGKGNVRRAVYKECLKKAKSALISVIGRRRGGDARRKIRTMVIYGLEPERSFMEGMDWLIENGIQPIISLFRPLKNTDLENYVAPPMISVYNLYKTMEKKYSEKGQSINLGPGCTYCQNNTLSLPDHI